MENQSNTNLETSSDAGPPFRRTLLRIFSRCEKNETDGSNGWRWPFFGDAAKIHAMEAKERYWILRREIEMHIDTRARCLEIPEWRYRAEENLSVEQHVTRVDKAFKASIEKRPPEALAEPGNNVEKPGRSLRKNIDQFPRLLNYYKILLIDQSRLTRKYQDLNLLWRDMNFVRTRLLSERLIDKERVPHQLDFCRIEAKNLGLIDDPEIKTMLDQAAEEMDVSGESRVGSARKARRLIVSLMAKLNDFRIRQIFEQIYKKRMYMALCFILLALSVVMFELMPGFLNVPPVAAQQHGNVDGHVTTAPPADRSVARSFHSGDAMDRAGLWGKLMMMFQNGYWWCTDKIASNPLIFIFFAGFTGGVFSAMMRFQPLNKMPGDELYIFWYRITKPVIGAFGAMVLYIIIVSPAFGGSVDALVSKEIVDNLVKDPRTTTGFAFGFLTGFSERIILPRLK